MKLTHLAPANRTVSSTCSSDIKVPSKALSKPTNPNVTTLNAANASTRLPNAVDRGYQFRIFLKILSDLQKPTQRYAQWHISK